MCNVSNAMSGDIIGIIVLDLRGKHSTLVRMLGTPKGIPRVARMVAEVETGAEVKLEDAEEQPELVDAEEVGFLMSELLRNQP